MCGEKCKRNRETGSRRGSPPHVRGKVIESICVCRHFGITPACAGKSEEATTNADAEGDHPRMCGEKLLQCTQESHHLGSPPHVRGKADGCPVSERLPGITPACAGKSESAPLVSMVFRDHPRMCGEKKPRMDSRRRKQGSPPHVRGKALLRECRYCAVRITPACAGKRFEKDPTEKGYKDHPRMCGEKLYTPCMIAPKVGSPPHVRGKEISDIETAKKMGITPACAGKR